MPCRLAGSVRDADTGGAGCNHPAGFERALHDTPSVSPA